ncbi:MAG: NUDIX hydrolase, partial [Candidatus Acidiferrales bacterium]
MKYSYAGVSKDGQRVDKRRARQETNSLEVLLVTTRQSRRWIIPEGWPIKRLKPPKSAAREASEEAGIRGSVGAKSIGVFSYEKRQENSGAVPCE